MKDRIRRRGVLCVGLCVLAIGGCRSAPTRLYSLSMLPASQAKVPYAGPPVRVDAVHLPAETDRVEITTQMATGGLEIHEFDHWAAPLSKMARQTLTADLIARLPPGTVIFPSLHQAQRALGLNVASLSSHPAPGPPDFLARCQVSGRPLARGGDVV